MDDGDDRLDLRSKAYTEPYQLGPLRCRHFNPLWQPFPQNLILGLQVLDHLHQFFFRGPGQEHQQWMDESLHGVTMRKSLVELEVTCF
jgi:hypothetical protein